MSVKDPKIVTKDDVDKFESQLQYFKSVKTSVPQNGGILIRLPDSVEKIGSKAFEDCKWLSYIQAPYVKEVEERAFKGCDFLELACFGTDFQSEKLSTDVFEECSKFLGYETPETISKSKKVIFQMLCNALI